MGVTTIFNESDSEDAAIVNRLTAKRVHRLKRRGAPVWRIKELLDLPEYQVRQYLSFDETARQMRRKGYTFDQIAFHTGMGMRKVRDACRGIVKPDGRKVPVEEARERWRNGESYRKMAAEYGASHEAVRKAVQGE